MNGKYCLFASLLSLYLILFPSSVFAESDPKTLRVGVILSFTGDAASVGEAVRNAMTLALEKLPKETRDRLELVYEDDAMSPKNTITAFRKLLRAGRLDVVVNTGSGTSKAIAPLVESEKIPLIAIATDPEVVAGRSWVVNFWVTPEEQVRVAIPEALRRNYSKIARITAIHDFTLAMKKYFDLENRNRIKLVLDEEFPPNAKDFRSFLTRLRSRDKVDAILASLMPGQLGVFAKQTRQMGIEVPIFGFETLEDSNEVKASDGALVGQWYVNTDDPDSTFIDEFRSRFPDSSLYGASNGYDIVLLLGAAVEKGATRAQVNHFLHTVKDFKGALGTYSATTDNRFTLPAAVKVVTEDGFKKVEF